MAHLTLTFENIDNIKGITLEERAKLVLLTLGRTSNCIHKAYRKLAKQCHPDITNGDTQKFQIINEAYHFLTEGKLPKRPLLADDDLIVSVIGKHVEPLIDKQKEWEEYERWRILHFYDNGAI